MINLAVYRILMPHLCRCVTVILPFKSFARVGARARTRTWLARGPAWVHQWRFCCKPKATYKAIYRLTIYQLVTIIMIIIATIIITITVTVASSRVVSSDWSNRHYRYSYYCRYSLTSIPSYLYNNNESKCERKVRRVVHRLYIVTEILRLRL